MKKIIYFCVLYFSSAFGALDKLKAGPFNIVVEKLEYCPGHENDEYNYTYKLKKFNRTTLAIDATLEITSPIDEDIKVTVVADQFTNNGWKENYLKKESDGQFCTLAQTLVPEITQTFKKLTKVNRCPIPVGNYSIKNYPLALVIDIKTVPVFFYNKYRAKVTWERNNKRLLCVISHLDFVPKRTQKG